MEAVEVVTVGNQDQGRGNLDSPGEKTQHVESRFVGPVHILDKQNGWQPCRQCVHQRGRSFVGPPTTLGERLKLAAHDRSDVEQRAEWARSVEWVARSR